PDDLDDASMELDHWKHRIVGARCGIDAVKRRVRSNEIAMSLRLHEDGGRVGHRGRHSLIETAQLFKHRDLMVGSFVEIIETAYQECAAVVAAAGCERTRFFHRKAASAFAGVDVQPTTAGPSMRVGKKIPFGHFDRAVDNGPRIDLCKGF